MRNEVPVTFETYYYFNLLEKIKELGKEAYDKNAYGYLDKFVSYLSEDDEALASIEKLVKLHSTSDLSIFFSDILEHLYRIGLDEALQKTDEYAKDFLELFGILLDDEEWKTFIEQTVIGEEAVAEQLIDAEAEEISFKEFCEQEISHKIFHHSKTLSPENQDNFRNFLHKLVEKPELADKLSENLQDPKVEEFLKHYAALIDVNGESHPPNTFINTFYNNVENFVALFEQLMSGFPEEMKKTFLFEEKSKESAIIDEAAEELISESERDFSIEEEDDEDFGVDKIEKLAEKAGELGKLKTKDEKVLEEERARRKLLQDYILGEISSCRDEIKETMQALILDNKDTKSQKILLDTLKDFKDLGQIHSYAGIELTAENLLKVFNQILKEDIPIPNQSIDQLDQQFNLLEEYIRESVVEDNSEYVTQLSESLTKFSSGFGKVEGFSIEEDEVLKHTFQEIINRKTEVLKGILSEKSPSNLSETDLDVIFSTVDNVYFWSNVLKLKSALEVLEVLKNLLSLHFRNDLTDENWTPIKECVDLLGNDYINTSVEKWQPIKDKLQSILDEIGKENLKDARTAYNDVTVRLIQRLENNLQSGNMSLNQFFSEQMVPFFKQLELNSILVKDVAVARACQKASIRLRQFVKNLNQTEIDEKENVLQLIESFKSNSSNLIDPLNDFTQYFSELNTNIIEKQGAPLETETEIDKEVTDEVQEETSSSEMIKDEEIQTTFEQEAQRYIETLQDILMKLSNNPEDKELWDNFETTIHNLRSSAQILDRKEISDPLTNVAEVVNKIRENEILVEAETLDIFNEVMEGFKQRINEPDYDISEWLTQLANLKALPSDESESEPDEIPSEAIKETEIESEESRGEEDVISLEEQDSEMLQIFKDEVTNNFETVEKSLNNIDKFDYDQGLFEDIDHSVHDICSAAKMLGLVEISRLSEKLETLCNTILNKNISDVKSYMPVIGDSMRVIKELTFNGKIERQFYNNCSQSIELALQDISIPSSEEIVQKEEQPVLKESPPKSPTVQVHELFLQEAMDSVEEINNYLLELEKNPDNEELKQDLMRTLHTVKGSAAMVYANKIETLAHLGEEILEKSSQEKIPMSSDIFNIFFQVVDEINYILEVLKTSEQEGTKNFDEILNKLYSYVETSQEKTQEEEKIIQEETQETPQRIPTDIDKIEQIPAPKFKDAYIRLNINQMNKLMNLAAELVISNNQLKNQLEQIKNYTPVLDSDLKMFQEVKEKLGSLVHEEKKIQDIIEPLGEVQTDVKDSLKNQLESIENVLSSFNRIQTDLGSVTDSMRDSSESYDENIQKLSKLSNEILDEIMQARLVQIDLLFQRFKRPIRDLADKFHKKIKFNFEGRNTELDRTLVEELYNPLLHIIRNAMDHGIEMPEDRKNAGKDETGLLEIKASSDRNHVNIEIHDDGRGIDLEAVKKKALSQNLLSETDFEKMNEQEILELLFYPGFSTRDETTTISGRGVGLDAVKSQIEKSKGNIRIYSDANSGTTFSIRIPISLSVIQSMLVRVSGHVYSIPLTQVEETLSINEKNFATDDKGHHLNLRGEQIPVTILSNLLTIKNEKPPKFLPDGNNQAIVILDQGNRVALAVDKIVRREEILIKSLGPVLKKLKYIIGGSIMADGEVLLILDVHQIIQESMRSVVLPELSPNIPEAFANKSIDRVKTKKKREKVSIKGRQPSLLVVDDSLSIRKYLSGILSGKGFITDISRNGSEALELLKNKDFDIIITDLEMPQMSGYELIETIRQDDRFDDLPIIVLTGRAGENFKSLTSELGADSYIVKPFKDRELFEEINNFIQYEE